MVDEHEELNRERTISRRRGDIEALSEVRLFRRELKMLRESLDKDEKDYEERLVKLEADCTEFRRKIAYGKGAMYGLGCAVAAFIYLAADTLKTAAAHIMNLGK